MAIDVLRELDLALWTIANVGNILTALFMISKSIDKQRFDSFQRKSYKVWSFYLICMFCANFLGVFWRLYIVELYGIEIARIVEKISLAFLHIGWIAQIAFYEKTMQMFKRPYFLYIMIGAFIASFLVGFHSGHILEIIYLIAVFISFSLFPIMYLIVGRRSEGTIRRYSFIIFWGGVLFGIGLVLQIQNVEPFVPNLIEFFNETLHVPWIVISPTLIFFAMGCFFIGNWEIQRLAEGSD